MNKILALLGVILILVTAAAALGLLDGGGSSSATPLLAAAPGSHHARVSIAGFAFKPGKVTVKVGARVRWTNLDSAPHTATADHGGGFDTGTLMLHQSKLVRFTTAGTYTYHCAFHPFMTGSVTVR
ncbi:MAG: hypothetical protein QOE44_1616 [Solirubrobacteraceae bacterium]|jgi:plastocyanin|nr:hypothetical protein [Solirubrobacteraceae bacterium]